MNRKYFCLCTSGLPKQSPLLVYKVIYINGTHKDCESHLCGKTFTRNIQAIKSRLYRKNDALQILSGFLHKHHRHYKGYKMNNRIRSNHRKFASLNTIVSAVAQAINETPKITDFISFIMTPQNGAPSGI